MKAIVFFWALMFCFKSFSFTQFEIERGSQSTQACLLEILQRLTQTDHSTDNWKANQLHELSNLIKNNDFEIKEYPSGHKTYAEELKELSIKEGRPVTMDYFFDKYDFGQYKKYFKSDGTFDYFPEKPMKLAVENGDEKLQFLRINIGHSSERQSGILKSIGKIAEKMPGIEIGIVVPNHLVDWLKSHLDFFRKDVRKRIKIIPTSARKGISLWAQDASKPVRRTIGDSRKTLVSDDGNRTNRQDLFDAISEMDRQGISEKMQSMFKFEGGNVIVGERNVFVGPDIVANLASRLSISRQDAISALSKEFGKKVIDIGYPVKEGGLKQVDYHIDLSMAVARNKITGKEEVILSSPYELFETVFGFSSVDKLTPDEFLKMKIKIINDLNDSIKKSNKILSPTDKELLLRIEDATLEELKLTEAKSKSMEIILRKNGYDVKKIAGDYKESMNVDLPINLTNVIFSGNSVIVPKYNSFFLDKYVETYFSELGYEVIPFESIHDTITLKGGVRCISETYRCPIKEVD